MKTSDTEENFISKNTSGSEWRKWDLHIHTPETAKNDDYKTSKEDVWDVFVSKLEENKDIAVLGITDYFSMKNYLKVKTYQNNKRLAEKYLIPNVELRLLPVTSSDKPINLHILFDPCLDTEDIEREFFRKLKFTYEEAEYSCIEVDLVKLGRAYQKEPNLDTKSAYQTGIGQFTIPFNDLKRILSSKILTRHHLVGVANSNTDGNSGIQHSSLCAVRQEIYRMSDFIFSGNPKDVDYFLGKGTDSPSTVVSKYGSLKPCITGSDAHNFDSMGCFPLNRFTWIKADPTFEGLKQIIYEPAERVRISESIPEQKANYQIINSISFDNEQMKKQTIYFNQNLNSIIGGRSSGKSVLLGCLARKAGYKEEIKIDNESYNTWIDDLVKNTQIEWKDKTPDIERNIGYFGQSKINSIAQNSKQMNKIIEDIIRMDENKNNDLDIYSKFSISNKTEITIKINDWITQKEQVAKCKLEIEKIGNKKGIEAQIAKNQEELTLIRKGLQTSMGDFDEHAFAEDKDLLATHEKNIKKIKTNISDLTSIRDINLFSSIDSAISSLSLEVHFEVSQFHQELSKEITSKWISFIDKKIIELKATQLGQEQQIEKIQKSSKFINGKKFMAENSSYLEKDNIIKKENTKLSEIERIESEIKILTSSLQKIQNEILLLQCNYYENLNQIIQRMGTTNDDVKIIATIFFDKNKVQNIITTTLNQKSGDAKNYTEIEFTTFDNYKKILKEIFIKLDSGKIITKGSLQQCLLSLFSDNYFSLTYQVTYDGDDFNLMSEGKKAFIVLRLLLDFDNKDCPILIDQPEDDLDNRAIYDQLVMYLREKKKKRQIILVTHNPNIVVGTDSELVIVANQNGIKNENQLGAQFEYYGGSLESTFYDGNQKTILLSQGIKEHVCDILEGGNIAFNKREMKYGSNSASSYKSRI